MLDLIACCLAWVGALCARTRACPAPQVTPRATPHFPVPPSVYRQTGWTPPTPIGNEVIDGHALDIVRPYVRALDDPHWRPTHESYRCQQRQRRRELVLAVMGQDAGPLDVHGIRVA